MKSSSPNAPTAFRQTICSRLAEADSLCLKIRDLLLANELAEVCFPVGLLARECLNNAVIHGNRNDVDKSILLCLWLGRRWVRLEVSDEGEGFDWRKAQCSRAEATSCSGRGLCLYALYAQRVRFNRRGNRITLWIGKKNRIEKGDCEMAAYVIEQADRQGSVRLTGDLTAALVPDLQAGLKEMLNKGARELVFDLASTRMLDSSGMGLLIAAANSVAPNGGSVRVTNVCPDIFRLLQSMRLTARLNVSGSAE
ncbi:MAG TPA: ATP-binding protein [Terracidiphilus sp.]|jgi:serine/threonine-protein kinase RsbW